MSVTIRIVDRVDNKSYRAEFDPWASVYPTWHPQPPDDPTRVGVRCTTEVTRDGHSTVTIERYPIGTDGEESLLS